MDLNEQAQLALDRLIAETNVSYVGANWMGIARQMWLVGFSAGMEATHALAEQAFAKLEAELS